MKNKIGLCLIFCLSIAYAKEPKFVVTGDQMEIIQGGKKLVFTGNARVKKGESLLTADKIIQEKQDNFVTASGDVNFKAVDASRGILTGRSAKADYFLMSGKGSLYGKDSELEYEEAKTPERENSGFDSTVKLVADKIDFDQQQQNIFAQENVRIFTSSSTSVSTTARFDHAKKRLVLEGDAPRPAISYKTSDSDSLFSSDRITMLIDEKRVILEGKVAGKIIRK